MKITTGWISLPCTAIKPFTIESDAMKNQKQSCNQFDNFSLFRILQHELYSEGLRLFERMNDK